MSLRQVMADDLRQARVWFNDGEMASWHDVNGARLLCVVDAATVSESGSYISNPQENRRRAGLMTSALTVYMRRDEYGGTPFVGQPVTLDGRKYRITSWGDDEGVLELNMIEVRARC